MTLSTLAHTAAYFGLFESGVVVINLFGSVSSDNYSYEYLRDDFTYCALK